MESVRSHELLEEDSVLNPHIEPEPIQEEPKKVGKRSSSNFGSMANFNIVLPLFEGILK